MPSSKLIKSLNYYSYKERELERGKEKIERERNSNRMLALFL